MIETDRLILRAFRETDREDMDFDHPAVPEGHPVRPHIVYVKSA